MAAVVLPENIPKELVQCFQQLKEYKTALPDFVISGLSVLNFEQYILCQPKEICSLKLGLHKPVPPSREKFLTDVERNYLEEMYIYTSMKSRTARSSVVIAVWPHLTSILTTQLTIYGRCLYGDENIKHVPLRYTQFHQVCVFDQIYTSMKSRTARSSVVIAVWPHLTSILTTQLTIYGRCTDGSH